MKLGFDIDGVIANIHKPCLEIVNSYNLNYDYYIFSNHSRLSGCKIVDDPKLNQKIIDDIMVNVIFDEKTLLGLKTYKDGVEAIRKLFKAGHTIHYITSRPMDQFEVTMDWLRKNHIPFNTLHVVGKTGKGKQGRALNLDFFLEDTVLHLEEMYRYKNRWRKGLVLLNRPWNENQIIDNTKFSRLANWKEVLRHLGIHKR